MNVALRPITTRAAEAVLEGGTPEDVRVPPDYPTEFSVEIAKSVGGGSALGPFFVHRSDDGLVVGEIGGDFTAPGVVEIGYAIVGSCWGRGYATDAVRALASAARGRPDITRLVAHTPLDRPASGRVVEKAGFTLVGEVEDRHGDEVLRVHRWELALRAA